MRVQLIPGDYLLAINYVTPGRQLGWALFWMGLSLIVGAVAFSMIKHGFSPRAQRSSLVKSLGKRRNSEIRKVT
jgi:hypothetical protein